MKSNFLKLGMLPYKSNFPLHYSYYINGFKWFTTHTLITYDHNDISSIAFQPHTLKQFVLSLQCNRFMLVGEEYCEDLLLERINHMSSFKYCGNIKDFIIHGMTNSPNYN